MTNADLVRRWFREVWNEDRSETVYELLATSAIIHGSGETGVTTRGPGEFLSFVKTMKTAFPDLRVTVEQTVSEGEWVTVRFTAEMTHTGTGLGFEPTGKRAKVAGMSMARVREGKIVESFDSWDQRGLLVQLGTLDPIRLISRD